MTDGITHDKIATFARLTLLSADTTFYFSVVSLRSIEAYLASEFTPPTDVRGGDSLPPASFLPVILGRTPATATDTTVLAILDGSRPVPNFSALHLCAMLGHLDVIRRTAPEALCHEARNAPMGLLTAAVWGGQMGVVRHLAETYPHMLDFIDNRESTPFHVACRQGRLDVVKYIAGVRPGFIDRLATVNTSALWAACYAGHLDVVKHLVSVRPSLMRVPDGDGVSPFWVACQQGHVNVVRFLFEVDPGIEKLANTLLVSPLRIACHMGRLETV